MATKNNPPVADSVVERANTLSAKLQHHVAELAIARGLDPSIRDAGLRLVERAALAAQRLAADTASWIATENASVRAVDEDRGGHGG